jgi:ABC-type glycerol-3-phosphate transport system substrate-binding protein
MKTLSVFQITLLAVFGACAVAGILIFAIATSTGTTSTTGPVVIWGTLDGAKMTSMVQSAIATYPELAQVSYVYQDPSTYHSALIQALASGAGPDIYIIDQDQSLEESSRAVLFPYATISTTQFQNAFIEAAKPFMVPQGVVALPVAADPLVLYWNKDYLASAGYAQPPRYWEELFPMAIKLTSRTDAGSIEKSAIALGEYRNVHNAKDILATLILQAGGTLTAYESDRLVSTMSKSNGANSSIGASIEPPAETALRFYTQFSDPSKTSYSWNRSLPDSQQSFAHGNTALYIGYASEVSTIRAQNPNLNFGIAGLPQIKPVGATNQRLVDGARVYGFAIARTSRNVTGAQTVASTLAQAQNSAQFASTFGISSARRDVLSQTSTGDQSLFDASAIAAYSWSDPSPDKTATLFQDMIENTTSGSALVGDVVGRADSQMTEIISTQH